jgi:hypothetical protein
MPTKCNKAAVNCCNLERVSIWLSYGHERARLRLMHHYEGAQMRANWREGHQIEERPARPTRIMLWAPMPVAKHTWPGESAR